MWCAWCVYGITFIWYAHSQETGTPNKLNIFGNKKTKGPKIRQGFPNVCANDENFIILEHPCKTIKVLDKTK